MSQPSNYPRDFPSKSIPEVPQVQQDKQAPHDNARTYPHYFKQVPESMTFMDIYDVLHLWGVTSPPLQHAIKKLLCAGGRGAKDANKDLKEARDSIYRALEMNEVHK